MTIKLKSIAVLLLLPLARLRQRLLEPLGRLWSYTRLRARLSVPLDPSVMVLGPVEVCGTGNVHTGRALYLYPGPYWETREQAVIDVGDEVVMSHGVHLVAFSGIEFGAGRMIGAYTNTRDANHRVGAAAALRWAGHEGPLIRIGRQVWLGRGVTVRPASALAMAR